MLKTLYFEDDPDKYWEVSNVLERAGIKADWVTDLQDGLQKWETARTAGEPYELILTDMQFPLTAGSPVCITAGDQVIAILREKRDTVPVIVCSSVQYQIPEACGCVWYSKMSMWQNELIRLLQNIERGVT